MQFQTLSPFIRNFRRSRPRRTSRRLGLTRRRGRLHSLPASAHASRLLSHSSGARSSIERSPPRCSSHQQPQERRQPLVVLADRRVQDPRSLPTAAATHTHTKGNSAQRDGQSIFDLSRRATSAPSKIAPSSPRLVEQKQQRRLRRPTNKKQKTQNAMSKNKRFFSNVLPRLHFLCCTPTLATIDDGASTLWHFVCNFSSCQLAAFARRRIASAIIAPFYRAVERKSGIRMFAGNVDDARGSLGDFAAARESARRMITRRRCSSECAPTAAVAAAVATARLNARAPLRGMSVALCY